MATNEKRDPLGPSVDKSKTRASNKGFLPMSVANYVTLLDLTARQLRSGKRGATPATARPIFKRLGINPETWCELVHDFGKLFYTVAGKPHTIDSTLLQLCESPRSLR